MKSALEKVRESPQSTKARILQAAQEVFAQKGFEGASTREIAARAGVNISSLHYHWESKETLYYAIFESIYEQLVDLVRRNFVKPDSADGAREMIERTMGLTFDFYADNPTIPKLLMRRMIEDGSVDSKPESDVMGPAWKMFADWTRMFTGDRLSQSEISFFMFAAQCVALAVMQDTPHVNTMLDGTIRDEGLRQRARQHMIKLVETLLGVV